MSRKLRNSVNAVIVTAALAAVASVGLAAGFPAARAAASHAAAGGSHHRAGHASRIRHSLAMPYFSFVPRG